jgi:hypothetical protein
MVNVMLRIPKVFTVVIHVAGALKLSVAPGAGLQESAYDRLTSALSRKIEDITEGTELCVGHSSEGAASALFKEGCDAGVVLLGAAPHLDRLDRIRAPRVLVVAAELDGVWPFSHFAVSKHRYSSLAAAAAVPHVFTVLRDASHMSFASGQPSSALAAVDLQPAMLEDVAHDKLAEIVRDFLRGGGVALAAAERSAEELAGPVIDALKLEGSTKLGHPACNSDFPTNPTCQYPKYPDHSAPFGPAPAPSPPLPVDCVCGSPWVEGYGSKAYALPAPANVQTKDAFHDVADTHPFHLPHIFNTCEKPDAACSLNVTTVTMPVLKAGDLWPQSNASQPLSAFELKTKFKSKEAIYTNAHVSGAGPDLDKSNTFCADINKAAYNWALSNAEPSVQQRFKNKGEPLVMVDDVEAKIGITGPEWIANELVYKRVKSGESPTGTHIEVQSWKFIVGNTNGGSVPWFFPVGMHYCKLLSPARVMEWIYTDSMRTAPSSRLTIV